MGKQKIDKCKGIVLGHRSTPQPDSHFEAECKSKTGKNPVLSLGVIPPQQAVCLLSYRVFICFCFVRKAHQKPK